MDIMSTTKAWRRQIAVTTKALRYVGVSFDEDSGVVTVDTGDVARGK